jgi:hypothetical protein
VLTGRACAAVTGSTGSTGRACAYWECWEDVAGIGSPGYSYTSIVEVGRCVVDLCYLRVAGKAFQECFRGKGVCGVSEI